MKYNNPRRSIYLPVIIAVSVSLGLIAGLLLPGNKSGILSTSIRPRYDKIQTMLNIINSSYVDTINIAALEESAITTVLRNLDPHSIYIPAKEMKRANEPLQGNFEGIGITFNLLTDTILVISTVPGGPSEKAGLIAGDKIIYVNDSLVAGVGITEDGAMGMLRGPRGTVVKVKVLRKGSAGLVPFEITRDKIPLHTIDVAYMINDHTGYIKINNFAVNTHNEFISALKELKNEGLKNLILDLRGNAGGVMEPAVKIANQFLEKGQLIVYTQGRAFPRSEARATGNGLFEEGKLVVLIDEYTASASEILAGAIQDNDRGTIIGRRSFGKGLVQEPVTFSDGSGMRLTIARYYTPTGRSIQRPYNMGNDKYYEDLARRFDKGGESFRNALEDTTLFKNLPKFKTAGGKIVYGGGGIIPDIFIPIDTTGVSDYFIKVRDNFIITRFALRFTENNRETLQKFNSVRELENYLDRQGLLDKFVQFASENGVKKDPEGIKTSGKIIEIQIKAYIARNILDNKGFYPIWEKLDNTLKVAVDYLEGNAIK